jgi:hypothetical protein
MAEREKNVLMTKLMLKIEELSRDMERFNLAEYMNMLNDPRRFLFINFMGGVARGFGIALGFTLLGALGVWIMQRLVILNLPIIGDFIAELVKIVQRQL